jgi:hypothetical protein
MQQAQLIDSQVDSIHVMFTEYSIIVFNADLLLCNKLDATQFTLQLTSASLSGTARCVHYGSSRTHRKTVCKNTDTTVLLNMRYDSCNIKQRKRKQQHMQTHHKTHITELLNNVLWSICLFQQRVR